MDDDNNKKGRSNDEAAAVVEGSSSSPPPPPRTTTVSSIPPVASTATTTTTPAAPPPAAVVFRSILPHEPLSKNDQEFGYIHLQGAFEPKRITTTTATTNSSNNNNNEDFNHYFWTKKGLEDALYKAFSSSQPHGNSLQSVTVIEDVSSPPYTKVRLCYSSPIVAIQVVHDCRSKKIISPKHLFSNYYCCSATDNNNDNNNNENWQFTSRQIQVTPLTTTTTQQQLPMEISWKRSNPPKFRRLICRHDESVELLQQERQSTRFVFISGLVDTKLLPTTTKEEGDDDDDNLWWWWWNNPRYVGEAVRKQLDIYDTSGLGIEIFITSNKNKRDKAIHFCHIGMRSPRDAKSLIMGLQGKTMEWEFPFHQSSNTNTNTSTSTTAAATATTTTTTTTKQRRKIPSDKLFLDYAAITKRSNAKAMQREKIHDNNNNNNKSSVEGGGGSGEENIKGEKTRSECTSNTKDVVVPGLVLIPNFVTIQEEEVLLAAIAGPTAPWAPSQTNYSKSGSVKRRVQHYGYVFDYETADVLRDRTKPGADCPPLPGVMGTSSTSTSSRGVLLLDADNNNNGNDDNSSNDGAEEKEGEEEENEKLESYFQKCVEEGRGWDAMACLLERTRRQEINVPVVVDNYDIDSQQQQQQTTTTTTTSSSSIMKRFPDLNQITVNSYEPGEGIGSHVDTPSAFSDGLISISLNGGVVMEFRKQQRKESDSVKKHDKNSKDINNKKVKKLVYLPPRSLLLMSGPARFEWEHMIVTRMTDTHNGTVLPRTRRVSLTMRTAIDLSGNPLPKIETTVFPPVWGGNYNDNNANPSSEDHKKNALVTPSIERDNVHAVYDAIATQWHHTRGKRGVLWPGATQFLTELPPGSVVADVGCGDGKYFPAIWEAGSYVIGTDISLPLLQQAAYCGDPSSSTASVPESRHVSEHRHHLRRKPAVCVADCMNIPMRTKSCDAAICIAVMHHISTRERRLRCIEELSRIVKVGGLINIQAWAMEQQQGSRRKFAGTDVFVPFNAQPKYLDKADTANQLASADGSNEADSKKSMAQVYGEAYNADFDEKKGLVVFKRYCHLYRAGELEEIVSQVDTVSLHESGYEQGNHFVILKVVK